jgi:hypothetical protein
MKDSKKTIIRSDVWVPATGVVVGVGLVILGVGLLYWNASAFWKGVGFALMIGGLLSGFNCYSVASTNSALPRVDAVPRKPRAIRTQQWMVRLPPFGRANETSFS